MLARDSRRRNSWEPAQPAESKPQDSLLNTGVQECLDQPGFPTQRLRWFAASAAGAAGLAGGHHREAWTTKGPSYEDLYTQNVVINMDDQEDLHRASLEGKSAKERPIWLRESTVQGAYSSEEMKEGKSRS